MAGALDAAVCQGGSQFSYGRSEFTKLTEQTPARGDKISRFSSYRGDGRMCIAGLHGS